MPRLRTRAPLAALLVLALGCGREVPGARLEVVPLVVGNHRITAEVAATGPHRQHGLMFRESLPEDHGMLFIFPEEKLLSFWMKNTPLPLSIAFADDGGRIVYIADLEPHETRPVPSPHPARYALEMNRGWFRRRGVFVGDAIRKIPRLPGSP